MLAAERARPAFRISSNMFVRTLQLVAALGLTFGLNCEAACDPTPQLEAEFQQAAALAAAVADPFGAWDKAEPFLAVRNRHPDNLFAHERYQDAVNEYGIEGHLRLLNREYVDLDFKHRDDPMFHYLYLRTLAGRSTIGAIQGLNDLLASFPDFAPAHRTLAEIYATAAFRNPEKEKLEKERYLAACPGGKLTHWPPPIPDPSPLLIDAERAFAQGADPERVISMTIQGLREFEWRSQRIRAFDWYTLDYKRQNAHELRAQYWKAWAIQERCYRKAGQAEEAGRLLGAMNSRAALLASTAGPEYWTALETLARLYAETGENDRANEQIAQLKRYLDQHPDGARAGVIEEIRKVMGGSGPRMQLQPEDPVTIPRIQLQYRGSSYNTEDPVTIMIPALPRN
jgi:hypothetical protein